KKYSVSFWRTNWDDGQGFSDISHFPVTLGVGAGNHAEIFGSFHVITRIERDTGDLAGHPLFFTSTSQEANTGTGGGILVDAPLHRSQWTSNQVGDLWLGAKFNLASQADQKPIAFAIRPRVKLPTGKHSGDDSVGSGKADFAIDAVLSGRNTGIEGSGYGGV